MTAIATPALEVGELSIAYARTEILRDLNLAVGPGETVALLGPSGSGKTSLLYAIAGFAAPSGGWIRIGGRLVADATTHVDPERRDVAVVFQHYALWPHLDALETAAYPIRRRGVRPDEARRRAAELLELMGVSHLAGRRPAELSGGEQQRVGVARALARDAGLLLLDEPTAHLDTPLRAALMAELAAQRARTGAAALYATHDVSEALAVADRVAVLHGGGIAQLGSAREVYERPPDATTARLTGPASILAAQLTNEGTSSPRLVVAGRVTGVPLDGRREPAPRGVRILVRPDWARLGGDLPGRVAEVWYRGPHTDYRVDTPAGALALRADGPPRAARGEQVTWALLRAWRLAEDV